MEEGATGHKLTEHSCIHHIFAGKKKEGGREREKKGGGGKNSTSLSSSCFLKSARTTRTRSIWSTNILLLFLLLFLLHRKLRSFPFDVRNDSLGKFEASCGALCTGSCDPAILERKLGANVGQRKPKGLSPEILFSSNDRFASLKSARFSIQRCFPFSSRENPYPRRVKQSVSYNPPISRFR